MHHKTIYAVSSVLLLVLFNSCMSSRTLVSAFSVDAGIKISYGSVLATINGRINNDLYYSGVVEDPLADEKPSDNLENSQGTITKDDIKYLSVGEEYNFSILPSEIVVIHITSFDGEDAEVIAYQDGKEETYTVEGANQEGCSIPFQYR